LGLCLASEARFLLELPLSCDLVTCELIVETKSIKLSMEKKVVGKPREIIRLFIQKFELRKILSGLMVIVLLHQLVPCATTGGGGVL
jgi:hypothetical protein